MACIDRVTTQPLRRLAFPIVLGALAACGEDAGPTQPDMSEAPAMSMALAVSNTWTPTAPAPYTGDIFAYDLGMAPNAAGESIVYAFGGTSTDENLTGLSVKAYNVATNTWSARSSIVSVFNSNGVGKIGNKLYFSGGYNENVTLPEFSNRLWAYDYKGDRLIRRADLPIFSAEGVTGVISGKLYVLPGACNGNGWPNPGYCAVEETRRFYRYDPAANAWRTRRQAPHFHRQGAAAVIDGKLYVAGGVGANGSPVRDLDVYDPGTNTWRTLAPLPTGGVASGSVLLGQFYVVVRGFDGTTPDNRAYAYNRVTNKWKPRAAPERFGSVTRVKLDGKWHLFTATGDHGALYAPCPQLGSLPLECLGRLS